MLDRFMLPIIKQPLHQVSRLLDKAGVTANQVTIAGFVVGMMLNLMVPIGTRD